MMNNKDQTKPKIAQVVCVLPPSAGGIGVVAHSYSDQLTKRGYSVTTFVPCEKKYLENKSYKVEVLRPLMKIGFGAILPQLLWKLRGFDIVHLHYPFFGTALFVACAKRLRSKKQKLVISYHMDINLSGWRKFFEILVNKYVINFILNSADKIIVSSEDYVENSIIQNYYFQNIKKFIEIPFGVPRHFLPKEKSTTLMQKYNIKPQDRVILFVGGLGPSHYFKGINYLIKSFKFIKSENVKALIVGDGGLKSDYIKLSKSLDLENKIIFSGYIKDEEKVDHFNLADIFILPSVNSSESFGIVLLEAMACGKPIIASNLKGVRSVVETGINGLLVEPKNSRDIANKIDVLLSKPEKLLLFGKSCIESVENKYRWSIITDKLERLYNNL